MRSLLEWNHSVTLGISNIIHCALPLVCQSNINGIMCICTGKKKTKTRGERKAPPSQRGCEFAVMLVTMPKSISSAAFFRIVLV